MFTIDQLDHVALEVTNVERSVRFYNEVLGLTPVERPAFQFPGAWLRISNTQTLHLLGAAPGSPSVHGGGEGRSRSNHFAMMVRSMREAEAHLRSKGITFAGPKNRPDGALQIFLADPDGHTIELCSLPQ